MVPLLLIVFSVAAAAVVAYGTHPDWGQFSYGLDLIVGARRFQWPLVGLSVVLSLGVVVLVISGRRRAWWLIGLAPVLALFAHRFAASPLNAFAVVENPVFLSGEQVSFLRDEDAVVGVEFLGQAYAYPYAALYVAPVVFQQDHDRRMVLLWSAFANRALAFEADRELRARELEVVSMPANAPLLYNRRIGQFINALKGETLGGEKPVGLGERIETVKTTWGEWRAAHPETKVMVPKRNPAELPPGRVLPYYAMPKVASDLPGEALVSVVSAPEPVAVLAEGLDESPRNITVGKTPVLLFREARSGRVRAFDRRVDGDLILKFERARRGSAEEAAFAERDTNSLWSVEGRAVDGPMRRRNARLAPLMVERDLYWGVLKHWYPELEVVGGAMRP